MRTIVFDNERDAQRWADNRNQAYRRAGNLNATTVAVVVPHPEGWAVMLASEAIDLICLLLGNNLPAK